ncbi:MAG: hypothetical protein H0W67_10780, partial [Gemmatimonadales bacterium]|nr:hypothetical protein [Gemmatimonadales bacterium]
MRDSSRRLLSALITMCALSGARPLTAATIGTVSAGDGMGARAAGIVHGFWNLVGSRPQSGSRADDSDRRLDLSDVSHPAELERRLRAVVRPAGAPGVSVNRGEARSGQVRINAGETIVGHLLV